MEGKGVLFKRFADIDVFDIEVDSQDAEEIIEFCQLIAPTFGGINLEDIRAPECFEIERRLIETLDIPVFHDDQHGTAIISARRAAQRARDLGRQEDRRRARSSSPAPALGRSRARSSTRTSASRPRTS